MLWKPVQSLWIFFITILGQPEVETKASNWNINFESLLVVVEWVRLSYLKIMTNRYGRLGFRQRQQYHLDRQGACE